jgi:DNA-binding winged helix-turn-helix (wHTH) protein
MRNSWNFAESDQVIAFPPFRLDRNAGRLLRGEDDVRLRCKTFAVLEYLAMRPGRLVAAGELLDAVWPATHVTPAVLAGCIRELRQALGDDARDARFVETAHGRGYRFIASPTVPEDAEIAPLPRTEQELVTFAQQIAEALAQIMQRRAAPQTMAPSSARMRRPRCASPRPKVR